MAHIAASARAAREASVTDGRMPSKVQAFLCFQRVQATMITREAVPLHREGGADDVDAFHQSKKGSWPRGMLLVSRSLENTSCHTMREKEQPIKRCCIDSVA